MRACDASAERAEPWLDAHTVAGRLRVPWAAGDFLILRALHESGGMAVAVNDDDMVAAMRDLGRLEGISAAPEGGATLCALRTLLERGIIRPTDHVVLFNTGSALKYLKFLVYTSAPHIPERDPQRPDRTPSTGCCTIDGPHTPTLGFHT